MNKETIIERLKLLPHPLLGGICYDKGILYDGMPIMNLRDACIDMAKDVIGMSNAKEILEFGTHCGHSSMLWLCLSEANVTTNDLVNNTGHIEWEQSYRDYNVLSDEPGLKYVNHLYQRMFPGRFRFIGGSSYAPETYEKYKDRNYDLCFVDGDHSYEGCRKDILNAIKLNIPYILVDDYTSAEEMRRACKFPLVELVKVYENVHNFANIGLALLKNKQYVKKNSFELSFSPDGK